MDYYLNIKEKLLQSEIYDTARDYAKDKNKVRIYFEIGELLSKAGKEYGKNIIKQYSEKLTVEIGKKYNYRTLYRMRKFYELFDNEKLTTLLSKLSWTYFSEVLSIKDENEILYYLNECINKTLTTRQLHLLIKSDEYKRLSSKTKTKIINNANTNIMDLVPDPIIIKVDNNLETLTEYALKQSILCNLDEFLSQLGLGFTYVGNEYKIKIGNTYNYIDILLYNFKYKCFVVIELKVNKLNYKHTGQIQYYMNYIDENLKDITDNKTVGIIICKKNNKFVIDYCSDKKILSREYELV